MGLYDRFILPPLLNAAMGGKAFTAQRQKIVPQAHGTVLEIGMGAGHNLPFYDRTKVTRLIGLEPHPALRKRAAKRASAAGIAVDFTGLKAEEIDLPAHIADSVVITYTLCTIPDVPRALTAIARVMKPDASLYFCEHGLAPDAKVARTQARLEPFWKRMVGGCHLCRPIPDMLKAGGFRLESLEQAYLENTPRFAGFNSWGRAVKAA
jgi:ubiquinone/menaquinone biosynthesis C-methylase UbiE